MKYKAKENDKNECAKFKVGDKVIWRPIDFSDMSQYKTHAWYGAEAEIIEMEPFEQCRISIFDFPECNGREMKNRFMADFRELELINKNGECE